MIRGLTVRPAWAWAIAAGGKRIENRTWKPTYRNWIAVHAATGCTGADHEAAALAAELAGRTAADVEAACVRGAIVAVARLTYVCSRSRRHTALVCDCGPWAMAGHHHLRLADVRALPDPVPCRGALGLWTLAAETAAAVRAQWTRARAA